MIIASRREAEFLLLLSSASVLHLSGGGYLIEMTRRRLWDHMLLLRLCRQLCAPSILTGHTVDYDYRILRGVIGKAAICFAMKHHPIVFALANSVPTIGVAVDD